MVWILDHFLSTFEKKVFLPLENLKTLKKFSKIAKNEVKAEKVAVLAAPRGMLATPRGVSVVLHGVLAVPPKSDQNHFFLSVP